LALEELVPQEVVPNKCTKTGSDEKQQLEINERFSINIFVFVEF